MTSKLDMVKARNLSIISVIATATLAAGFLATTTINQQEKIQGTDIEQVYAGQNTTFVLDVDGVLWGKGLNTVGQLGVGDFQNKSEWTEVAMPEDSAIKKVSVGNIHTAVLTEDNEIYSFGDNRNGILGNGTNAVSLSPVKVIASNTYTQLTAGEGFVIAVGTDGNLYSWGKNDKGQLGLGDKEGRGLPQRIDFNETVSSVKAGKDFAVLSTSDGRVFTWGANDKGQLGLGDKETRTSPTQIETSESFASVNTNLTSSTVVALTFDGRLFTWGANDKGQLGNGSDWREEIRLEEERVANEIKAVKEADEANKKKLVEECVDTKTKKWEKDNPPVWEELPEPDEPTISDPDEEPEPPKFGWVKPEAPDFKSECEKKVDETFAPTDTSDIKAREIKEPKLEPDSDKPQHVGNDLRFIYASVGSQNGVAVSTNNKLYTWGSDANGQNGNSIDDANTHTQTPKLITADDDFTEYVKAEASDKWSVAVTAGEALQVWGSSANGVLATAGSKVLKPTDITTEAELEIVNVAVGKDTGYATSADGVNYSWGGNSSGVLGHETTEAKNDKFTEIGRSLHSISPSGAAVLALGGNNNLYGWGTDRENAFGEDTANETVQQTVRRLQQIKEFRDVSAGKNFTAAVDSNGKVWVWGSNSTGVYTDLSIPNMLYPVKVETSEDYLFSKIEATEKAVYAVTEHGELISWGAGRSFIELEAPVSEYELYSTTLGLSLLSSEGELWRTSYELGVAPEADSSEETTNIDVFEKLDGTYNAVSRSISYQTIAQRADDEFLTWGSFNAEELEEVSDNLYVLDLPLPKMEHIALSKTHYIMFDINKVIWMWGEEPSGTFMNKGFVSIPQSTIFNTQKADNN